MLLKESNRFRLLWNIFMGLATMAVIVQVSYELAFAHDLGMSSNWLYYSFTVLFLLDIYFASQSTYRTEGKEIVKIKQIRKRFVKKHLLYDLVSVLPFDLLFFYSDLTIGGESAVLVIRLLAFLRLRRLKQSFDNLDNRNSIKPGYIRLIKFLVLMFILNHLIACGWIWTSYFQGFEGNCWVVLNGVVDSSPAEQYLRSIYWTVTTMTTIGYGDIAPHTNVEYAYTTIVMLLGASMYAYIIGNIASLVNNLDTLKSEHKGKVESLSLFLKHRKVSTPLITKVKQYYDYIWERKKGVNEEALLDDLPTTLRLELMQELTQELMEGVHLFKLASRPLKTELLARLNPTTYPPGSVIVHAHTISYKIGFISKGEMSVVPAESANPAAVFTNGDYYGLIPVLLGEKTTANLVTNTYCEVFELSVQDYEEVRAIIPEFNDVIKTVSSERSRKVMQLLLDKVVV